MYWKVASLTWWDNVLITLRNLASNVPPSDIATLLEQEKQILAWPDSENKHLELARLYSLISRTYAAQCEHFDYNTQVKSYHKLAMAHNSRRLMMRKSDAVLDLG